MPHFFLPSFFWKGLGVREAVITTTFAFYKGLFIKKELWQGRLTWV